MGGRGKMGTREGIQGDTAKIRAIWGVVWKLHTVETSKNIYTFESNLNAVTK